MYKQSKIPGCRIARDAKFAPGIPSFGVNLLAGRALTLSLESFSGAELGKEFDLDFALEWGLLPFVRNEPEDAADSYRFGAIQVFPVKDFVRALFVGEVF